MSAEEGAKGRSRAGPLPPVPVLLLLVRRTALLWAGVRAVLLPLGVGFGPAGPAAAVVALVTGLVVFETRRRSEHVFLGNLGVSATAVAAASGLVAALLEVGAAQAAGLL